MKNYDYVLLLTVLVYKVLNSCLPLQGLHNPIFESKTLHKDYEIYPSQHGDGNNQTIVYADKHKRLINKKSRLRLMKNTNNKSVRHSSQEPLKANKYNRNVEIEENIQDRQKPQVNDYNDLLNTSYDYQGLLEEYYMESQHDAETIEAYQPVRADLNETNVIYLVSSLFFLDTGLTNCTTKNDIGLQGIICLIEDIKSNKQPMDLVKRFGKIAKIWFLVYLVVAVPLWCTKGWCCCCLNCKFFKPQQTIDEARRFLLRNPPGIYQKKNRREIHYNPSEREKQCYEEFEHLIKTL